MSSTNDTTQGSGPPRGPGPVAPPGWPLAAVVPALAGAVWLWCAAQGFIPALLGALPGTLLLATGLSNLLWAGDARIFQFMALGAASGMVAIESL